MYYIRLLHGPRFESPTSDLSNTRVVSLAVTVAICNDLGEQRLRPPQRMRLTLTLMSRGDGLPDIVLPVNTPGRDSVGGRKQNGANNSFYWAANTWICKAEPQFSAAEVHRLYDNGRRRVWISVGLAESDLAITSVADILPPAVATNANNNRRADALRRRAIVFPVHCECQWGASDSNSEDHDVVRRLALLDDEDGDTKHYNDNGDEDNSVPAALAPPVVFETADDIGDSIACHVWDSGIAMVAVFADLCLRSPGRSALASQLPTVKSLLTTRDSDGALAVLELGAGVCSQGMGLAVVLSAAAAQGKQCQVGPVNIVMTDVEGARPRAMANIEKLKASSSLAPNVNVSFEILDWQDGARGVFGPVVQQLQPWNMILVSDCTYNCDTIPLLVDTFSALHRDNMKQCPNMATRILLSTKQRHDSEEVFHRLIKEAGWLVREEAIIPFPVSEDVTEENMEIYLLEKSDSSRVPTP